jgi:hypothetical protein
MPFCNFFADLPIGIQIIKRLVPAANQEVAFLVIGGNWGPLHAPNRCVLLDFVALVEIPLPDGDGSIHGSEGEGLSVGRPSRTQDLLLVLLLGDVLLSGSVDREVGSPSCEQLVSQGIESQSDHRFCQRELQVRLDFAFCFEIEPPEHAGLVVADLGSKVTIPWRRSCRPWRTRYSLWRPSLNNGLNLPALVGFVMTSPF